MKLYKVTQKISSLFLSSEKPSLKIANKWLKKELKINAHNDLTLTDITCMSEVPTEWISGNVWGGEDGFDLTPQQRYD